MSVPPSVEAEWRAKPATKSEVPFFPNFLLRELIAWYIVLAILGTLAAFLPWELGVKADAFAPAPAGIRPEWYFMLCSKHSSFCLPKSAPLPANWRACSGFDWRGLSGRCSVSIARTVAVRRDGLPVRIFALTYIIAMTVYGYLSK